MHYLASVAVAAVEVVLHSHPGTYGKPDGVGPGPRHCARRLVAGGERQRGDHLGHVVPDEQVDVGTAYRDLWSQLMLCSAHSIANFYSVPSRL